MIINVEKKITPITTNYPRITH